MTPIHCVSCMNLFGPYNITTIYWTITNHHNDLFSNLCDEKIIFLGWQPLYVITVKYFVSSLKLADTYTVYLKKYAHGFCFSVLCCDYTLTDFPISIRLTSLALWQSNDCPSASKATLINMDKYFMWIRYERLHNHNKAKHNKTVCIFLGIYCRH